MSHPERSARELLVGWVQLSRGGAFGKAFEDCEPDCECVVCETEALLERKFADSPGPVPNHGFNGGTR